MVVIVAVLPMWLMAMLSMWPMAVLPVWLMYWWRCFMLRVLYAFSHVITPSKEARFTVLHAVPTVLSDFPLRSGNFSVF